MKFNNKKQTETETEVLRVIKARWKKGRVTYGEGISYKQSPDIANWVQEAIEEAADLLQYLVALKLRIEHDRRKKKR